MRVLHGGAASPPAPVSETSRFWLFLPVTALRWAGPTSGPTGSARFWGRTGRSLEPDGPLVQLEVSVVMKKTCLWARPARLPAHKTEPPVAGRLSLFAPPLLPPHVGGDSRNPVCLLF